MLCKYACDFFVLMFVCIYVSVLICLSVYWFVPVAVTSSSKLSHDYIRLVSQVKTTVVHE